MTELLASWLVWLCCQTGDRRFFLFRPLASWTDDQLALRISNT
jgi:hypothetical protein